MMPKNTTKTGTGEVQSEPRGPEPAIMPECAVCHMPKKPWGRSAPLEMANGLCDHECPGYDQPPHVSHLWPEEPR